MKNEVLLKICDMIASGEIPKEVYNKYLGDTPIGFMRKYEIEPKRLRFVHKNAKEAPILFLIDGLYKAEHHIR